MAKPDANPNNKQRTTVGKALRINLDLERYGSFAEIGAGQEVARHFFLAGKASQTIALTISAYDMVYSDHIYGKEESGRYVCESRLRKMLDHEYEKLQARLGSIRGQNSAFFAFASTVATSSGKTRQSHGWVGVRFQTKPMGPINEIYLHVRMIDKQRLLQQETLGVLGVNLCFAAFYYYNNPQEFVSQIVDNIKDESLAIDAIKIFGPDLNTLDEKRINLELIKLGYAEAILFNPSMSVINLSDCIYNKNVLLQRGIFKPVTKSHLDVLSKGQAQLKQQHNLKDNEFMTILELTTEELQEKKEIDYDDYLFRVECLCKLGFHVLVSNLKLFYKLKNVIRQSTSKPITIVANASVLEKLFDETYYSDLEGGPLEGLGKLLDKNTQLYIYPNKTADTCYTTKSFFPHENMAMIYKHFLKLGWVQDISGCDEIERVWHSNEVQSLIESKSPEWKNIVPEKIIALIEKKKI